MIVRSCLAAVLSCLLGRAVAAAETTFAVENTTPIELDVETTQVRLLLKSAGEPAAQPAQSRAPSVEAV